jgi:hypothetical protein
LKHLSPWDNIILYRSYALKSFEEDFQVDVIDWYRSDSDPAELEGVELTLEAEQFRSNTIHYTPCASSGLICIVLKMKCHLFLFESFIITGIVLQMHIATYEASYCRDQ